MLLELSSFTQKDTSFQLDKPVFEYLKKYCVSGKLVRGSVFLAFLDMLSVSEKTISSEARLTMAACIELFGSGVLIQDDIMDGDTKRRGLATVHTWLAEYGKTHAIVEPKKWGESVAICFTDTVFFYTSMRLSQLPVPPELLEKITTYSFRELALLGMAQAEDLRQAGSTEFPNQAEILRMFVGKTGRYTARWPLALALLVAGGSEEQLQQVEDIAEKIGVLYQIRDDFLGVFGDSSLTGKNTTSDIREGKKTLYAQYFFAHATTEKKEHARRIFGVSSASESECQWFVAELKQLGAEAAIEVITQHFVRDITLLIEHLDVPEQARQFLLGFTTYAYTRTK